VRTRIVTIVMLLLVTGSVSAVEWTNKAGLGVRGLFGAPLFKGSDFGIFDGAFEPYGTAWGGDMHITYGVSKHISLNFSLEMLSTWDDSTATSSQSFHLSKKDDAYTHLEGHLFGLTASYHFFPDKRLQPYFTLGLGIDHWRMNQRTLAADTSTYTLTDFSGKFGGGLNYWILEQLTIDFQTLLSYGLANMSTHIPAGLYGDGDWSNYNTRPFRGLLQPSIGLTFYFGGAPDSDKDGVSDDKDQCPNTPLGAIVDEVGCPLDSDGDGVYDGLDICPDTPLGAKVDDRGCPLDSDKDGVYDGLDLCPDTPEGVEVDEFGCPIDSDRDGVADYKDKCPDTPFGAVVDANGCPVDSDGDGVPDFQDRCPGTPANIEVDTLGCPKAAHLTETITLVDGIKYASGSFIIRESAKPILDSVALILRARPYLKIDIRGYCDPTGTIVYNQKLSEDRAASVRDYFRQQHSVALDRMNAVGFGESPEYFIGDNSTAAGRQLNRRVEIESKR